MIYVVATLTIKPETRADFIAAATACIQETRKEPGNIAYDLHEERHRSLQDGVRRAVGNMPRRWCRIAAPST